MNSNLAENLRFQIVEVQSQLEKTQEYLSKPSRRLLEHIISRDNYIDNLKSAIQRKCFALAADKNNLHTIDTLNAIYTTAANLEHIADLCEKIVHQVISLEGEQLPHRLDCSALFDEMIKGVSLVFEALINGEVKTAITICNIGKKIDELYTGMQGKILQELNAAKHSQDLINCLFIVRYQERMGSSMINIGESIISAFLGDRVKIAQLEVLEKSLLDVDLHPNMSDLTLKAMGETKSGCRIDLVSCQNGSDEETLMIFKEGKPEKLHREKIGVEYWKTLMPGIAPAIYAHREETDSAALLFEYLHGDTFEKILVHGSDEEFLKAQTALKLTLSSVWLQTRRGDQRPSDFMQQIRDRINHVYQVHPEFSVNEVVIGEIRIPSFDSLLDAVERIEKELSSPFCVLTHGDFNIDNIIYEKHSGKIRFIDLHRSAIGDYVQDISVFMVSNFRLQVFDAPVRRRINEAIRGLYIYTAELAREEGDDTFTLRLTLGLIRSLITSTRFVLDKAVATDMLLRARYLMEMVIRVKPGHYSRFKLPEDAIIA